MSGYSVSDNSSLPGCRVASMRQTGAFSHLCARIHLPVAVRWLLLLWLLPGWGAAGYAQVTDAASRQGANTQTIGSQWLQDYDARAAWYEKNLGRLPKNIVKMRNMVGVWRGGGLVAFPATRLGNDVWAYATSGLTNSDMPATLLQESESVDAEQSGRIRNFSLNLKAREPAPTAPGLAGYGYEVLMLLRSQATPQQAQQAQQAGTAATAGMPAQWPMWVLQWLVTAEIYRDVGLRSRVLEHNGLIVHSIALGEDERINLLIVPAPVPLARDMQLPHGKAVLLLAITVSDAEVRWAARNGHEALFARLMAAGSQRASGTQSAVPSYAGLISSRSRPDATADTTADEATGSSGNGRSRRDDSFHD